LPVTDPVEGHSTSATNTLFSFSDELPLTQRPCNLKSLGAPLANEDWRINAPLAPIQQGPYSGQRAKHIGFLQASVEVPPESDLRNLSAELYSGLLDACRVLELPRFLRIWNYIPEINKGEGDSENYRQFCWGRADCLGDTQLPAATGIGSRDGWVRIGALVAASAEQAPQLAVTHLENPRQLSAWKYPRRYGPRSPSFARATLVRGASPTPDKGLLLVSGTASIVNHQSCHPGDLQAQTREAINNVQALLDQACKPDRPAQPVSLRYYLRNEQQLAAARSAWESYAPQWPVDCYLGADICRNDLLMEVEGVFSV